VFAAAAAGRTARWIGDPDVLHTVSYLPDIAAGLVNPVVKELGETWYQRDRDWVVDDTAFRAAFGEPTLTPHEDAVKATLAWYRGRG
jgi:hypothetical protein